MVKRSRRPGRLTMTGGAVGGELCLYVVRVRRRIVIRGMTTGASIGRGVVIPVVTSGAVAGNRGVRPV